MKNKIKVLHLLASNKFSGAENVVCTIIKCFTDEVEMIYCSPFGPIEDSLKEKNINYYGIKKLNLYNLKKAIKKCNPDIIHAHDYSASVLAALSGFKGKIISHLHSNCPFAKKWNYKSILYNATIKKYSSIVGVSNQIYEEAIFKEKMKDKYSVIYNYLDTQSIIDYSNAECYLNYDLFFIGRLTELKNPFLFIQIVREIQNVRSNIRAVMIGEGNLFSECRKMIDEIHVNIDMLGFRKNPYCIIKRSKIGIMPSAYEGFGLTALESLILNKPVLNSGMGGLKEIFKFNKELICNDKKDYINKALDILNSNKIFDFSKSVIPYTSKLDYKNKIRNLYK